MFQKVSVRVVGEHMAYQIIKILNTIDLHLVLFIVFIILYFFS